MDGGQPESVNPSPLMADNAASGGHVGLSRLITSVFPVCDPEVRPGRSLQLERPALTDERDDVAHSAHTLTIKLSVYRGVSGAPLMGNSVLEVRSVTVAVASYPSSRN